MKNGSGSRHEEEGRPHARRDNYIGPKHSRSASRAQRHHYSPTCLSMIFYASKESRRNLEVSLVRHQRRIYEFDILEGELRNLKPPTFDDENKRGDGIET
jgi:hypothetical protein